MAKQYGLIKPEKGKLVSRLAIFNEESDSEEDVKAKPTGITSIKKKERLVQEKAVLEDPTVYQYDELYDDMQSKRKESKLARKDLDKKPKYINKLLETADRRKRENERRIERQVQKEREEEGDKFKDKESFVTSAYRKKLEEMKELEEKEKREEYLESIGDVRKQSDLSGFYRHIYAQQVNFENEKPDGSEKIKVEKETKVMEKEPKLTDKEKTKKDMTKRKYRKQEDRSKSDNESETEISTKHLPSNIDADSDFSIDSDSASDTENKKVKPKVEDEEKSNKEPKKDETNKNSDKDKTQIKIKQEGKKKTDDKKIEEDKDSLLMKKPEVPKKPKKDIWKKRTVGKVFDDALKRYYERKASRVVCVK